MPFEKQIKQPICKGLAPGMYSSAPGTGSAQLFLESSIRVIPWAQAGLAYTTVQLSICIATTKEKVNKDMGKEGRKEGHSN